MTIVLSSSIASVQTGVISQAVTSASLTGVSTGLGLSSLGQIVGRGLLYNTYGSMGASASAGALLGTCVTGTPLGTIIGSISGALTSGAFSLCTAFAAGPIGLLILGAESASSALNCTFDCWKPILHEGSNERSNGILFKDIVQDFRIKSIRWDNNLVVENIWNEKFIVNLVQFPSKHIALHATEIK